MMHAQSHRGPDDAHTASFTGCVLGFNRLSVLDVSLNGRQPMTVPESPSCIVFNGEIYNYLELAQPYRAQGIQFKSRSDTEVLLQSYLHRGESCLRDLNGMWAFAIYDPFREELFASRDRFGVKPFYYFKNHDYFCFSSEIKALLQLPFIPRKPDHAILFGSTFERSNDRCEHTSFDGILQLPPAHSLRIGRTAWSLEKRRYWSIQPPEPLEHGRVLNAEGGEAEEFRGLLESAVVMRLRSDREMGLLLSGGMDSSAIAATLSKCIESASLGGAVQVPRVFTLALPGEPMDESKTASETARKLGLDSILLDATQPDFESLIPAALWHNDEPLPLMNRCVHWQMMERIAGEGVIVILNGQGGDETCGGYFDRLVGSALAMALRAEGLGGLMAEWKGAQQRCGFSRGWMAGQFLKTFINQRLVRTLRAVTNEKALQLSSVPFLESGILRDSGRRLVKQDYVNDQLMRWLTRDTVPDLCHYEDRNAAAHGLEERFPFLDFRLVEFMFRLPWAFKAYRGVSKVLVRDAMKGRLPVSVLESHRKVGLGVPEDKWIRGPLAPVVEEVAASRSFRERGLWRVAAFRSMVRRHMAGEIDAGNLIWRIVGVELWYRMFMDREEIGSPRVSSQEPELSIISGSPNSAGLYSLIPRIVFPSVIH